MRFYGLNQTQIQQVNHYVEAYIACPPDGNPPKPPNEKVSWLTFWCQVELLRTTKPYLFWVSLLALVIIVPVQLMVLVAFAAQKLL